MTTGQEVAPYLLGGAAVSNPIWLGILQPSYQILVMGLGLVVIVLTIRNKWLEIQIKKRTLEE
jgi:hypothetical protein